MKINARSLHRDLGNFYLGLIVAFSLSGIFLNHRQSWYPTRYTVATAPISVGRVNIGTAIDETVARGLAAQLGLLADYRGFRVNGDMLRLRCGDDDVEIDLKTGKGQRETFRKVPILADLTKLHVDTASAWIWYSDIFGAAMLTIAATGIIMQVGKNGFLRRGWKLAALGLLFPLVFLVLLQ
jgi:hypothetical protein